MNIKNLEIYRDILLSLKKNILNGGMIGKKEDLQISAEDLPDEADIATNVINQQVTFSIRNQELNKLRQIEVALQKIEEGTYGTCDDCDEYIGAQRLKNQPWANLCIIHAEEREKEYFKKMF